MEIVQLVYFALQFHNSFARIQHVNVQIALITGTVLVVVEYEFLYYLYSFYFNCLNLKFNMEH